MVTRNDLCILPMYVIDARMLIDATEIHSETLCAVAKRLNSKRRGARNVVRNYAAGQSSELVKPATPRTKRSGKSVSKPNLKVTGPQNAPAVLLPAGEQLDAEYAANVARMENASD